MKRLLFCFIFFMISNNLHAKTTISCRTYDGMNCYINEGYGTYHPNVYILMKTPYKTIINQYIIFNTTGEQYIIMEVE